MKYLLLLLPVLFLAPQLAYGYEITATPTVPEFGPNDSLRIDLRVDGYIGGDILWQATAPDETISSGKFSNIQNSRVQHLISRDAFDNKFGTWKIDYQYKDATKSIDVVVKPLVISMTADKPSYAPGDTVTLTFTTNYYEPRATSAEFLHIDFADKDGKLLKLFDGISTKVTQPTIIHTFSVNSLFKYYSYGTYKMLVQYYNTHLEVPLELRDPELAASIFLGTDKPMYNLGEVVEINIALSNILADSGVLKITSPNGKIFTKNIPISSSLTRVKLTDYQAEMGTHVFEFEYAGSKATKSFNVFSESLAKPTSGGLELKLALDKEQYRPGEPLKATVTSNKLIENNITYWFSDPNGQQGVQFSFVPKSSGTFIIPHILNVNSISGPWKMHVKYGTVETFAIFFVAGKPVDPSEGIYSTEYVGPKMLLTIDSRITNFVKILDIATSPFNELYVLESSQIKVFDSNGNLKKTWKLSGTGQGNVSNPSAVFVEEKYVHVADSANSRIVVYDHDGKYVKSYGNLGIESRSLKSPSDITKSLDKYYISDKLMQKIPIYNFTGSYQGQINSILTASAKFSSITSLVADDNNTIFLLDSLNNRILNYGVDGIFIKSFGTEGQNDKQFSGPSSITIDSSNNLYVADAGNHRVQVLDAQGTFLTKWGEFGNGPGQFNDMSGIAVDNNGNVWVADVGNNRIQKFAPIVGPKLLLPDWIKNNAKWWSSGQIPDNDFLKGIEFMIKENVIKIPQMTSSEPSSDKIPDWIKNTAGWWADDLVSDKEFANAIEFLIKSGIIAI